tara:strand:- start:37 stop:168 length:132 start_codon:yes stop_codon:yes gene_type:complete
MIFEDFWLRFNFGINIVDSVIGFKEDCRSLFPFFGGIISVYSY